MFSDQDIDYSLNRPCRSVVSVAPSSSSTKASSPKVVESDDEDNNEDYLLDNSSSLSSHRFLVSSSIPSISKLSDTTNEDGYDNNNNNSTSILIEEEDENRINKLYLLEYHEDSHELTQETSWVHPTGETWSMACHPTRSDWVATCGGGSVYIENSISTEDEEDNNNKKNIPLTKFHTTLWRIPDLGTDNDGANDEDEFNLNEDDEQQRSESKLESVVSIPHGLTNTTSTTGWEQRVGQILWNPLLSPSNSSGDALYDLADSSSTDGGGNLITVGWDAKISPISLWDISSLSDVKEVWSTGCDGGGVASSRRRRNQFPVMNTALPRRCSWDPHDTHHILATSGVDVITYDMRAPASSSGMSVIRSAHNFGVTDVSHNHLQSNVVVTSGMDGEIKFWDIRMHLSNRSDGLEPLATESSDSPTPLLAPLLKVVRGGHTHWTTRATYNPFYDQLVLSGGTDGIANLWRISSCSSAPLLDLDDDEEENGDVGDNSSYGGDDDDGDDDNNLAGDKEDANTDQEQWNENIPDDESDKDDDDDKGKKSSNNESNAADIRVTRYECSDATADVSWSLSDPWVYATLSYDGAIVVHHVPSKEKYKILL